MRPRAFRRANLIDATPIGANIRSTVATIAGIHDDLRRAFAKTDGARERAAGRPALSHTIPADLRCSTCDGTGSISFDVQFLPDVDLECPDCRGTRYARCGRWHPFGMRGWRRALAAGAHGDERRRGGARWIPCARAFTKLATLHELGLGYLTLGEPTPALSGGEAQRLKLASEMGRGQSGSVFVFDEPTIGLHPLDVRVLLRRVRLVGGFRSDGRGDRT